MKIKFLQTRTVQAADGETYEAGKTYELTEASAQRWIARGVAEDVSAIVAAEEEAAAAAAKLKAEEEAAAAAAKLKADEEAAAAAAKTESKAGKKASAGA